MRKLALAAAVAALGAPALAGCTETYTRSGAWTVRLGPGGAAEAHYAIPTGKYTRVQLQNRGPGTARFVLRNEGGRVFHDGEVANPTSHVVTAEQDEAMVIALTAAAESAVTVVCGVVADTPYELTWDMSRANNAPASPPPSAPASPGP